MTTCDPSITSLSSCSVYTFCTCIRSSTSAVGANAGHSCPQRSTLGVGAKKAHAAVNTRALSEPSCRLAFTTSTGLLEYFLPSPRIMKMLRNGGQENTAAGKRNRKVLKSQVGFQKLLRKLRRHNVVEGPLDCENHCPGVTVQGDWPALGESEGSRFGKPPCSKVVFFISFMLPATLKDNLRKDRQSVL